ncbi:MAG: S41 family peptidase [Anaerolineae bacterium]
MIRTRGLYWVGLMAGMCTLLLGACATRPATPQSTAAPVAPPTPSLQLRAFEALWSAVNENYLYEDFGGVDWQAVREEYRAKVDAGLSADAFADLVRAMLAELPEGAASWQTRAERIEAESTDTASYEGIGAFVAFRAEPQPRVVLLAVMPDSPAEKAGLAAHDSILAVDGVAVKLEEGQGVVTRIRGPAGSDVTLRVRSPGKSARDVVVTRGGLSAVDTLKVGATSDGAIGYLLFPATSSDTLAEEVRRSVQALNEARELDGLILDLRIASTGGGWPLAEMLALFGDGDLGEVYTRTTTETLAIEGQNFFNSQSVPLAIIVGPDTDGAPEIFTAAMQAIERARVVGLPTPGLVEAVNEFPMPDGSLALITTSSYRTPKGRDIGRDGVEPNVPVKVDWDAVTTTNDPVRDAAAQALERLAR